MVINISVQYNGGFLPDIILLTQGYYHRGTRLNTMYRLVFIAYICNSILLLPCVMVYYIVCFVILFFWCTCMAINLSVQQYNGGLLPDIILLTQCYFHRGTRLNAKKRFCICSLLTPPKRFDMFPPYWRMLRRSRCVRVFL